MQRVAMPELARLFHVPNGGARSKATAWRLKQEGVQPGVPDMLLLVPRGNYHGMAIEMKNDDPKGRLTPEQADWLADLSSRGYATMVAYRWTDAADALTLYLRGEFLMRSDSPGDVPISQWKVWFPDPLFARLKALALATGLAMIEHFRRALEKYLRENGK